MAHDLVKILDGNTFVVSDSRGDIEASLTDPTGLFSFDTRFLSKWVLTINGDRLRGSRLRTTSTPDSKHRSGLLMGNSTTRIFASPVALTTTSNAPANSQPPPPQRPANMADPDSPHAPPHSSPSTPTSSQASTRQAQNMPT